jgi:hypothetical protein
MTVKMYFHENKWQYFVIGFILAGNCFIYQLTETLTHTDLFPNARCLFEWDPLYSQEENEKKALKEPSDAEPASAER